MLAAFVGYKKSKEQIIRSGLEEVKKKAVFQVFIPTDTSKLVLFKDWRVIENDKYQNYQAVEAQYKTQDSTTENPVIVSVTEQKIRDADAEFLRRQIREDDYAFYERVEIGSTEGIIGTPKNDLPVKNTSYDPRLAPFLSFRIGDTFITIRTTNKNFYSAEDLVRIANSLKPID